MTKPRKFPIVDSWTMAFDRYGSNGVLWSRVAHLQEDAEGWAAMVSTGYYRQVFTEDGADSYYTTHSAFTRIRARWIQTDGELHAIAPSSALARPSGPLPEGLQGAACDLHWCREASARLVNGLSVCAGHAEALGRPGEQQPA